MNKKTTATLDDYTVFRLLCEIEMGDVSSQRDLSRRMESALGLVNSYLKVCSESGWIKVSETSLTKSRYQLTVKGAKERRRLALIHSRYIDEILAVVNEEYRKIGLLLKLDGIERVAFCGIDGISGIAMLAMQNAGVELSVAMDTQGVGSSFMGREIVSIAHAMLSGVHRVVITSLTRAELLHDALLELGTDPAAVLVPSIFLEHKR